jgi:hypothetical protein
MKLSIKISQIDMTTTMIPFDKAKRLTVKNATTNSAESNIQKNLFEINLSLHFAFSCGNE